MYLSQIGANFFEISNACLEYIAEVVDTNIIKKERLFPIQHLRPNYQEILYLVLTLNFVG